MRIIKQPAPKAEIEISKDSLQGEVNRFGVKLVPTDKGYDQWIIDAKTGKPARREDYSCMESNGLYLWVKNGEVLRPIDGLPYPSVW